MTATDSDTAARARALLDAATPEEWEAFTSQDEWYVGSKVARNDEGKPMVWRPVCGVDGDNPEALAALIAAAPTLITDLLAEVDRWRWAAVDAERQCDEVEAERDALRAAIRAHRDAVKCCDECAAAQVTDPHPNDHDGPLWAAAERGTDRQRDDDRHPLTRFMKARSNEWGTDR